MEELDQLIGGWILTGLVSIAAGLWVLMNLSWPLDLVGLLFAAHGAQGVRLGRRLALGHNDPKRRRALATTLVIDTGLLAVLAAFTALFRH